MCLAANASCIYSLIYLSGILITFLTRKPFISQFYSLFFYELRSSRSNSLSILSHFAVPNSDSTQCFSTVISFFFAIMPSVIPCIFPSMIRYVFLPFFFPLFFFFAFLIWESLISYFCIRLTNKSPSLGLLSIFLS